MAYKSKENKRLVNRFFRLFREYRELEKDLEREAALAASLQRYIEALEGRDRERVDRIAELEAGLRERDRIIGELREHLSGMLPGR